MAKKGTGAHGTGRREFIRRSLHGAALLAAGSRAWSAPAAGETPPNIVFLFSDDHALRTISAYPDSVGQTPNIDRIAREGALFRRSYCTNSICCPSRATILTGAHSHINGVRGNGNRWDGTQPVFPRLLKRAGYQTALIGKWHLRPAPTTEFDHWEILSGAGGQGHYYNPQFQTAEGAKTHEGYSSDVIADRAMSWLDGREEDRPFLLMCQFKAPHVHRLPAARFMDLHENETIPEPPSLLDRYQGRLPHADKAWMKVAGIRDHSLNITPAKGRVPKDDRRYSFLARLSQSQRDAFHRAYDPRNEEFRRLRAAGKLKGEALVRYKYQRFIKDYLRCVAAVDENVGRVLTYLDEHGLTQNTVVVYASDQGYYTGEHGWAEKRWMYEESLSMPFLIRWPGHIAAGQKPTAMIQNLDYAPTFLDIAGVPVPKRMQGRSLLPVLQGKQPEDWRRSIYYHYYDHGKHNVPRHDGVRTERYKLVHYYTDDSWELFDLENDPQELASIYGRPAAAALTVTLKAELTRLRALYNVPAYSH